MFGSFDTSRHVSLRSPFDLTLLLTLQLGILEQARLIAAYNALTGAWEVRAFLGCLKTITYVYYVIRTRFRHLAALLGVRRAWMLLTCPSSKPFSKLSSRHWLEVDVQVRLLLSSNAVTLMRFVLSG
jgi:hypothetical protein